MKQSFSYWGSTLLSALLIVSAPASFADVQADKAFTAGKKLFTGEAMPPCAICHTLADAGSSGQVGPVLDEIRPDRQRVLNALRSGLGQMPSFKEVLTDEQMQALATYVSKASGGAN